MLRTRSKPYRWSRDRSPSTQYSRAPRRSWLRTSGATTTLHKVPRETRLWQESPPAHAARTRLDRPPRNGVVQNGSIKGGTAIVLSLESPHIASRSHTRTRQHHGAAVPGRVRSLRAHLAIDRTDSQRLFAVAHGASSTGLPQEVLWRTADGGRRRQLAAISTARRRRRRRHPDLRRPGSSPRSALAGCSARYLRLRRPRRGAIGHVGTRVSTDGGVTFGAFGSVDTGRLP